MLPLLIVDKNQQKKRKSSAIEATMWGDQNGRSMSFSNSLVSRNRGFFILLMLVVFMLLSISSTTIFRFGNTSSNGFQPPENSFLQQNYHSSTSNIVTSSDVQVTTTTTTTTTNKPALRRETEAPPSLVRPDSFGLVIVADLDKKSKDTTEKKPLYFSFLQHATLKIDPTKDAPQFSIHWGERQRFTSQMNEAGRGFELSELTWFNGKLLSFDDRTGIVYELKYFDDNKPLQAIPQQIVMEGNGIAGKGQKHEWATVKDGELYMGSIGKEFTDDDGNVLSDSNFWVAILNKDGIIRHEDWASKYGKIRKALKCEYPGYVIHEAIEWSEIHRKWFFLPRRVSQDAYNYELDEKKGSNKLVIASEDFSTIEVFDVGTITPLRGFSSFKFLPRSNDRMIVAIKSVEVEAEGKQTSFLTVFNLEGKVLLEETELPLSNDDLSSGGYKYEGIAFIKDWTNE
jgi:soluble calcium-activated nucleotidase 1